MRITRRKIESSEYICAMSWTRDRALSRMSERSDTLAKHLIKCVVYPDNTRDRTHWIQEISSYLEFANDITLKPKNRKPNKIDFEDSLFDALGNTKNDAKNSLKSFLWENNESHQYPEFGITNQLIENVFQTFKNIHDIFIPILTQKNSETLESIQEKVEGCIVS